MWDTRTAEAMKAIHQELMQRPERRFDCSLLRSQRPSDWERLRSRIGVQLVQWGMALQGQDGEVGQQAQWARSGYAERRLGRVL